MSNEYLPNKPFEEVIQSFQSHKKKRARLELIIKDLEETHNRRKNKYKDNLREPALIEAKNTYKKICNEFKEYENQLTKAFYILAENIASYAKFKRVDIDEQVQEGVLICFEKVDRFNPSFRGKNGQKAKAFNYMTTCILNHYRQLYRSSKNYFELKKKYHSHLQDKLETVFYVNGKERSFYN